MYLCKPFQNQVSITIWGCISWHGLGILCTVQGTCNINAEKYINIRDNHVWTFNTRHFPKNDFIFQDDNAPVHEARAVEEFKRVNHIWGMIWPAQSSDNNINKNCWQIIIETSKITPEILLVPVSSSIL